jgi:nucleoid DNA-binding protein
MKITRAKLVDTIHERMNGELSKQMLDDAILLISNHIGDALIDSGTVSVDNFGTLHAYTIKGHVGQNVATGELQYVKPKRSIMFAPHVTLTSMIDEKRNRFKTDNS